MDKESWLLLLLTIIITIFSIITAAPVFNDVAEDFSLERDCLYNGKLYSHSLSIETEDPCLNCTCNRGVLVCFLRVCPNLVPRPNSGCSLIKTPGSCCAEIVCGAGEKKSDEIDTTTTTTTTDQLESQEYSTTSSMFFSTVSEDDTEVTTVSPANFTVDDNSINLGCWLNGSLYAEGSAMLSSSFCEYCYCIRGKQRCIRPQCHLSIDDCGPIYHHGFSCCPSAYHCNRSDSDLSHTTTTAWTTNRHDCVVDGTIIKEGDPVVSSNACSHCFCVGGKVQCSKITCPLHMDGCKPIIRRGKCCPTGYSCSSAVNKTLDREAESGTELILGSVSDSATTEIIASDIADNILYADTEGSESQSSILLSLPLSVISNETGNESLSTRNNDRITLDEDKTTEEATSSLIPLEILSQVLEVTSLPQGDTSLSSDLLGRHEIDVSTNEFTEIDTATEPVRDETEENILNATASEIDSVSSEPSIVEARNGTDDFDLSLEQEQEVVATSTERASFETSTVENAALSFNDSAVGHQDFDDFSDIPSSSTSLPLIENSSSNDFAAQHQGRIAPPKLNRTVLEDVVVLPVGYIKTELRKSQNDTKQSSEWNLKNSSLNLDASTTADLSEVHNEYVADATGGIILNKTNIETKLSAANGSWNMADVSSGAVQNTSTEDIFLEAEESDVVYVTELPLVNNIKEQSESNLETVIVNATKNNDSDTVVHNDSTEIHEFLFRNNDTQILNSTLTASDVANLSKEIIKLNATEYNFNNLTDVHQDSTSSLPHRESTSPPPLRESTSPPPRQVSTSPPLPRESSSPPPPPQSTSPPPRRVPTSPLLPRESTSPPPPRESTSPPPLQESTAPPRNNNRTLIGSLSSIVTLLLKNDTSNSSSTTATTTTASSNINLYIDSDNQPDFSHSNTEHLFNHADSFDALLEDLVGEAPGEVQFNPISYINFSDSSNDHHRIATTTEHATDSPLKNSTPLLLTFSLTVNGTVATDRNATKGVAALDEGTTLNSANHSEVVPTVVSESSTDLKEMNETSLAAREDVTTTTATTTTPTVSTSAATFNTSEELEELEHLEANSSSTAVNSSMVTSSLLAESGHFNVPTVEESSNSTLNEVTIFENVDTNSSTTEFLENDLEETLEMILNLSKTYATLNKTAAGPWGILNNSMDGDLLKGNIPVEVEAKIAEIVRMAQAGLNSTAHQMYNNSNDIFQEIVTPAADFGDYFEDYSDAISVDPILSFNNSINYLLDLAENDSSIPLVTTVVTEIPILNLNNNISDEDILQVNFITVPPSKTSTHTPHDEILFENETENGHPGVTASPEVLTDGDLKVDQDTVNHDDIQEKDKVEEIPLDGGDSSHNVDGDDDSYFSKVEVVVPDEEKSYFGADDFNGGGLSRKDEEVGGEISAADAVVSDVNNKEGLEDSVRVDHAEEHAEDHGTEHANDHGTGHAEDHGTGHAEDHGTEHAEDHGTEHAEDHGTGHAKDHGTEHAEDHGTEHAEDHGTEHAEDHGTEHAGDHDTEHAEDHGTEHAEDHGTEHAEDHDTEHAEDHGTEHAEEHSKEPAEVQGTEHTKDYDTEHDEVYGTKHVGDHSTAHAKHNDTKHDKSHGTEHSKDQATEHDEDHGTEHTKDHGMTHSEDHGTAVAEDHSTALAEDNDKSVSEDHGTALTENHGTALAENHGTALAEGNGTALTENHGTPVAEGNGTEHVEDHNLEHVRVNDENSNTFINSQNDDHTSSLDQGHQDGHAIGFSDGNLANEEIPSSQHTNDETKGSDLLQNDFISDLHKNGTIMESSEKNVSNTELIQDPSSEHLLTNDDHLSDDHQTESNVDLAESDGPHPHPHHETSEITIAVNTPNNTSVHSDEVIVEDEQNVPSWQSSTVSSEDHGIALAEGHGTAFAQDHGTALSEGIGTAVAEDATESFISFEVTEPVDPEVPEITITVFNNTDEPIMFVAEATEVPVDGHGGDNSQGSVGGHGSQGGHGGHDIENFVVTGHNDLNINDAAVLSSTLSDYLEEDQPSVFHPILEPSNGGHHMFDNHHFVPIIMNNEATTVSTTAFVGLVKKGSVLFDNVLPLSRRGRPNTDEITGHALPTPRKSSDLDVETTNSSVSTDVQVIPFLPEDAITDELYQEPVKPNLAPRHEDQGDLILTSTDDPGPLEQVLERNDSSISVRLGTSSVVQVQSFNDDLLETSKKSTDDLVVSVGNVTHVVTNISSNIFATETTAFESTTKATSLETSSQISSTAPIVVTGATFLVIETSTLSTTTAGSEGTPTTILPLESSTLLKRKEEKRIDLPMPSIPTGVSFSPDGLGHQHKPEYCVENGEVFQNGERIPTLDFCAQCKCNMGEISCQHVSCAKRPVGCVERIVPSSCCPTFVCNETEVDSINPGSLPIRTGITIHGGFLPIERPIMPPHDDRHLLAQPPLPPSPSATVAPIFTNPIFLTTQSKPLPLLNDSIISGHEITIESEPVITIDSNLSPQSGNDQIMSNEQEKTGHHTSGGDVQNAQQTKKPVVIPEADTLTTEATTTKTTKSNIEVVMPQSESTTKETIRTTTVSAVEIESDKTEKFKTTSKISEEVPTTPTTTTPKSDEVVKAPANSLWSMLKVSSCNIYGRVYRLGSVIGVLSGPCKECKCTDTGVNCYRLKCF